MLADFAEQRRFNLASLISKFENAKKMWYETDLYDLTIAIYNLK